jgi:hypothetical protein
MTPPSLPVATRRGAVAPARADARAATDTIELIARAATVIAR